jgi:3-deoxy-D-manno-octulosonic-acid transferase
MLTPLDLFYSSIVIPAAKVFQGAASIVSSKWRRRAFGELRTWSALRSVDHIGPRMLMHAASMGEFEQLITVATEMKRRQPDLYIIASVFSPSAYDHARRCQDVDLAVYLPLDGRYTMKRFITRVQPDLVVVDRYDLWRNFAMTVRERRIPLALINATIPSAWKAPFIRPWMADTYRCCSMISAVTEVDAELLKEFTGRPTINVAHDTRMDRIVQRSAQHDPEIEAFRQHETTTIVMGSSWPKDEDLMVEALTIINDPSIRLIIVPHEPTETHLKRIQQRLPSTRLSAATPTTKGHLLVDSMGKLISLYRIAQAAFIGGGFGAGVHSVSEAAGHALPIACGPKIDRSRDGIALKAVDALTVVGTANELADWLRECVVDELAQEEIAGRSKNYVESRTGSSESIAGVLHRMLLQQLDATGRGAITHVDVNDVGSGSEV